ncbi:MAG: signal recognition particle protein [Candidatus Neomarinimicrobiota bacterium]|jgi:signal recognition particle subunit SRP54|nr:signal recognition particle protein [Candidatus Neomarinimicrobiota bacterium]MDD3965428.1 signal recognition particle protein [Candidatus Neomarinimicrobiota bacterium]
MLEQLRDNLQTIFKNLRGQGKITEQNIALALRDVRRTLLEADVNYGVARSFIDAVKEKALGEKVLLSITPGQQVIKIIHDEMVRLLGDTQVPLKLDGLPPAMIMVVGLQGSGKTTFAAKLAKQLKASGKRPMLVAADIYRPAAIEQLQILGEHSSVPVYREQNRDVLRICRNALAQARNSDVNVLIFDTAGRLHVDDAMMEELSAIHRELKPREVLFVADGMIGQDAVNAAKAFNARLDVTGIVLTKMDGDARGGAALSIRSVTGKPIKYISAGESTEDLEAFHPERFANRILGKGDVVTLVEKAQEAFEEKDAERLEKQLRKNRFDLHDFREQLKMLKKMGPLSSLVDMIPGAAKLKNAQIDETQFQRTAAILDSMTREEKSRPEIINAGRRRRIAAGSGTQVSDVNRLLNQFDQMKKMMKQMNRMKLSKQAMQKMKSMPWN